MSDKNTEQQVDDVLAAAGIAVTGGDVSFGGGIVLGDSYGVTGGTVVGDVYLGAPPADTTKD